MRRQYHIHTLSIGAGSGKRWAGPTGVHHWLPLGAPLAELLGVLALQASSLLEARHDVAAGLEGVFGPPHRPLVVARLSQRSQRSQRPWGRRKKQKEWRQSETG